ncbi:MAG: DEAD/DEAH box helicase [Thermoplasmatota archaeon]
MEFNSLPISDGTKDAVAAMGYENATPIQERTIPVLLEGTDVIGKAQTGTGKTAAFGIPVIEHLAGARHGVQALVLCPTRELALQVTEVMTDVARASPIKVVPVYGGAGFQKQLDGLRQKAPLVVVACPGRLLDLHQRGDIDLSSVSFLVLDEADRMLDMGFIHDMRRILKLIPAERQNALFSATLDARVQNLAKDFTRNAVTVEVEAETETIELTEQFHVAVEKNDKAQTLVHLLHQEVPQKAVVFMRTKHQAKRMAQKLDKTGWSAVALQGNMTQNQREKAMAAFRDGKARILVATDVAARGLDVPDVSHVINVDIPHEPEQYVHRVGRTGRNGQTGRSFTFVEKAQAKDWGIIQKRAGTQVPTTTVQTTSTERGPDKPAGIQGQPQQNRGSNPRPKAQQGGNNGKGRNGQRRGPRRQQSRN